MEINILKYDYPEYCEDFAKALINDDFDEIYTILEEAGRTFDEDEFFNHFEFITNDLDDYDIYEGWEARCFIFKYKSVLYGIDYTKFSDGDEEIDLELYIAIPTQETITKYVHGQSI